MKDNGARGQGLLIGVGLGPGDPELVTPKAQKAIARAEVVAYPSARHGRSVARSIAEPYLREGQEELPLVFPLTTEPEDPRGGYEQALVAAYDEWAQAIAERLAAGRTVAFLCEGDPFVYGSYIYLHERLAPRFRCEVVPGVPSFCAAAAAAGVPLAKRDDALTVLPGTLPEEELARRLAAADAATVLKLGRTFGSVRRAAQAAGVAERAVYVERASTDRERVERLPEVAGDVPYMSILLVPTGDRSPAGKRRPQRHERSLVTVVGIGPGAPDWLTPEAHAALCDADELVGYAPYLERVPRRPGQRRHPSDNRQELERARQAIALAREGRRVAVVSSGDPGVFAMATAVCEALDRDGLAEAVDLQVIPGITAMQAAAARVGAPLGHDFCVLSLSDRLKPWALIERRLRAASAGDLVLALYNPASRSRREQLERARKLLLEHRDGSTPVVVARALGSPEEAVEVTTLADLDCSRIDMRCLLIVGSSRTRVVARGGQRPAIVYTPRSY
ncbi:precorrin-3B C(17)-methyltransferase [Thermoleophilum album]|uniref:Precorrin-2 C20-methyltransferase / precorrin-3B C17-methyltransferase n=1 Tax=Thermoleophilum album TaxID=29539 RepID=A0A1H6FRQ8_THEAL|nr:precorrin-3B C(17)-methyltransferase [Thermoleophilum album]SEH12848.1 precorrin-2 C20-methyltransferase / precorrin-3B C17-methyltransferase [Thermoleophilum album]